MKKKITILGSTGSIGRSTLDVAQQHPDAFEVVGLAAHSNWERLAEQVAAFSPERVAVVDPSAAQKLSAALNGRCPDLLTGEEGVRQLAAWQKPDMMISGIVGAAGFTSTLAAVMSNVNVGLANKESLVTGGHIIMREARDRNVRILPVDSEHSAVFQSLLAGNAREVKKIILTASGGPFRTWPKESFDRITLADALKHPNWKMGKKITIDSATMMNKALEIIEARWLFDMPVEKIEVVVHPQSIIHSIVAFQDGSMIAQMGVPDMRVPIQYALTFPDRLPSTVKPADLAAIGSLDFEKPDPDKFPAVALGFRAAHEGGTSGAVLNAANEAAVAAFLDEKIPFTRIVQVVEAVMDQQSFIQDPSVEDIMAIDQWAREEAFRCLSS